MIVVRFKVQCRAGQSEQVRKALERVIAPSRTTGGVIGFDIGRALDDPDSFIATEVFEDRAALDRQEALPEVAAAMAAFEGSLATEPEATIFEVSSSEPA